jgi:ATP-dependent RNA helicase DeaD
MRGIMFCRTKRETQQIADDLGSMGYGVEALHGDLSQGQRDSVMKRFKARSMQLLIATDVAARGIDVNDLTHVIHHSLPEQLEGYTHRSGRTARAGKKGVSLAFINPREGRKITDLEKKFKIKFEKIEVPSVDALKSSRINNWAHLIINTKVDEQAEEILQGLKEDFAHLSKEDILKRLITTQMDNLMIQGGEEADLNEIDGDSRRESSGKRGKSGYNRYFVNIGSIDGLTKGDLIHYLSDVSGIKRKAFGDLSLQKNCAYFDVDSNFDSGLSQSFKGVEIEGRSIRVNRDDEGNKRSRGSSDFKKKKDYGKYKKANKEFPRARKKNKRY